MEMPAPFLTTHPLIAADALYERERQLGAEIDRDFAGLEPLLVTVLQGALVFTADLIRHIQGHIQLASVAMSSYPEGSLRLAAPRLRSDLDLDVSGRDIIIVEDIVDTGHTVRALIDHLSSGKPASVCVATCLSKPSRRAVDVPLRYVGFEVPDLFVVGYGLDWSGRYRNLPLVAAIEGPIGENP
jgi:hypoxanthine phosphoribosyltransferase